MKPRDTYISNILINNGYGIMHRQDSISLCPSSVLKIGILWHHANPDAYLQDLYHNYMEIPPVGEREKATLSSFLTIWKKLINPNG